MRVMITGIGGELGSVVAKALSADPSVGSIMGIDLYPPRRRLSGVEFHRIDPRKRRQTAQVIMGFAPTALVHLGVYEPYGRSTPTAAVERTAAAASVAVRASLEGGALDRIVVRSGIEVYGRRRGAAMKPDEDVEPDPTSAFGQSLEQMERTCREAGLAGAIPVTLLRMAPIVGPNVPSPLGRLLRLPFVPFYALGDPPFSVVHQQDAADAVIRSLADPYDGPLNIVGPGAVTVLQAARIGGRVPTPVIGPTWRFARTLTRLVGAPVPEHVQELLSRGRSADGSRAVDLVGFRPAHSTPDAVRQLYKWPRTSFISMPDQEAA